MPGCVIVNGIRYCLVPGSPARSSERYWPSGPQLGAEVDATTRRFLKPHEYKPFEEPHYAILEDEIFVPKSPAGHQRVFCFPGSESWPFSFQEISDAAKVSRQGDEAEDRFVTELLSRVRLTYRDGFVTASLTWEGISLERRYELAPAKLVASIWPSEPISDWPIYLVGYVTANPQTRDTIPEKGRVGIVARRLKGDLVTSSLMCRDKKRAILRVSGAPEFLEFRYGGGPAGMVPLGVDQGGYFIPRAAAEPNAEATRLCTNEGLPNGQGKCDLAIDFGTTNSAIAVRVEDGTPELLSLSGCGSASLTRQLVSESDAGQQRLDSAAGSAEIAAFFFPANTAIRNPLPSLVFENRAFLGNLEGLSLPRRSLALAPTRDLLDAARDGDVTQNFKWNFSQDGEAAKRAFLETLSLLAALSLRKRGISEVLSVRLTAPLILEPTRAERQLGFFDVVGGGLRTAGLSGAMTPLFISESYANACYAAYGGDQSQAAFGSRETIVVVDIGGGTCDIGVFRWVAPEYRKPGHAEAKFLDSLRIGGMDFVEGSIPLRGRQRTSGIVEEFTRKGEFCSLQWPPGVKLALFDNAGQPLAPRERWPSLFGLAFSELVGDRAILSSSASLLGKHRLSHRLMTLLSFAVAYGAILGYAAADEGGPGAETRQVRVFLSGLGAGFVDLSPVLEVRAEAARRRQFELAVQRIVDNTVGEGKLKVGFGMKHLGKLAVSCGALYVNPLEEEQFAKARHSICWSRLDGKWDWRELYPAASMPAGLQGHLEDIEVEPLARLVGAAVGTWGGQSAGSQTLREAVVQDFRRVCESGEYPHPVDAVVGLLKQFAATGCY